MKAENVYVDAFEVPKDLKYRVSHNIDYTLDV